MRATLLATALVGAWTGIASAEAPGGDAFGNFVTSSKFDPGIPTNLFFDISATGTFLIAGDDVSARDVFLGGLSFPFYGQTYTHLTFATNGYISTDPTDNGPDLSNDPILPSPLSSGGGARIYPYHDDTEARIYGQYFPQMASPFGTDIYVAQWDACHYNCYANDPAQIVLRYNVMLFRDGTIVVAYDKVSTEAGGGATVGIQNETATDGYAYLANEMVLTDGMTILITTPTSFQGLGSDLNIVASEIGMMQTGAQADITSDAVKAAFAAGSDANVETASTGTSSFGAKRIGGFSVWAGGSAVGARGSFGPRMNGQSYAFHAGFDYLATPWALGGVSFAYADSRLDIGMMRASQSAYMVEPYIGLMLAETVLVKGSFQYGSTRYNVDTPLGQFNARGNRYAGSLAVSAPIPLPFGGLVLVPEGSLTVGTEKISNIRGTSGILIIPISIPVGDARFVTAEATLKLEKSFVTGSGTGKIYGLAGVDYVDTNGNDTIALFATNYRDNRTGGVAGAGISFNATNGFTVDAHVIGRGLGTSAQSVEARGRVGFTF